MSVGIFVAVLGWWLAVGQEDYMIFERLNHKVKFKSSHFSGLYRKSMTQTQSHSLLSTLHLLKWGCMQRLTELPREVALSTLGQVSTPGLYSNLHLCPSPSYSGSEEQKKRKKWIPRCWISRSVGKGCLDFSPHFKNVREQKRKRRTGAHSSQRTLL